MTLLEGPRLHGESTITYRDANYAREAGWKEIVVGADTSAGAARRGTRRCSG